MHDSSHLLFKILREDALWPMPEAKIDELTFNFRPSEIKFLRNESAQIDGICQLRPITGLTHKILIVNFGNSKMNRFTVRRIAMHFSTRPQRTATRLYMDTSEVVYFILHSTNKISVAHFRGTKAISSDMAVSSILNDGNIENIQFLDWKIISTSGFALPKELYVRFKRTRSTDKCSYTFLLEVAPEKVELFSLALAAPSISQLEEDRLVEYAQLKEPWAISKLVELNLKLVFETSAKLFRANRCCNPSFEDIFAGAIDGLLTAIQKYEIQRGHRFATYCWMWVNRTAERSLVSCLWPIEIPFYLWEKVGPASRQYADAKSICDYPGLNRTLEQFLDSTPENLSIAELLLGKRFKVVPVEKLEDLSDANSTEAFNQICEISDMTTKFPCLTARELTIVLLRFGLSERNWGEPKTLEQVASSLGVTRERVRQVEMRAIKKLRKHLE